MSASGNRTATWPLTAMAVLFSIALAACGQTGPLSLPNPPDAQAQSDPSAPDAGETQDEEENSGRSSNER